MHTKTAARPGGWGGLTGTEPIRMVLLPGAFRVSEVLQAPLFGCNPLVLFCCRLIDWSKVLPGCPAWPGPSLLSCCGQACLTRHGNFEIYDDAVWNRG